MTLLDAALRYSRHGWPVLPVNGKRPITRHGSLDATTDETRIRAWWEASPDANVGIATGLASGLLVVDVDGPEGEESWRRLAARFGQVRTLTARTGGGGWHLYFRVTEKVRNSARRPLGPGLDSRGCGGFAVAPPSRHQSGGIYAWHNTLDPVPAPEWLLERLRKREQAVAPLATFTDAATPYGRAAIAGLASDVAAAKEGSRNHELNAAAYRAGRLAAAAQLTASDAQVLVEAALRAGLTHREAERTFWSGFAAGLLLPAVVEARELDGGVSGLARALRERETAVS